ncbi:monovalent cation/H+ antiporter complex subunit F [Aeromicrobium sp. 50.2.37]|uniref:monovalent cation/H+ antiporter complex subunit F n=1 Tax=Aeromicrobium sp. 50.2.37 TaxID=2969305 RepID=UPI00215041BE|nr:monovalent cation/H+ antiporter complex subunit F [Aeromicrobium sp. 50.2.37]MCR4513437.1 monovalent cation/H+ antiporter complex subunit F [Aeromicrobium sp. 50.2.37]
MIGIDVALVAAGFAAVLSAYRIVVGPTPADRAVASDLLTFAIVALIALVGARVQSPATLDLVLVATLVAFLSSVSLARALTRGWR